MKKQIRVLLASAMIMGIVASCDQSEVNELEIQNLNEIATESCCADGGDDPDPEGS